MAGNLRTESHLLDQKFDAQPGARIFLVRGCSNRTGVYITSFPVRRPAMPALNTFRAGGQHPIPLHPACQCFSITSSATVGRCWRVLWAARICSACSRLTLSRAAWCVRLRLFQHRRPVRDRPDWTGGFRPAKVRPRGDKGKWRPASGGAFPAESAGATAH